MVRKLPLVLALHERGIAEWDIALKTGLTKATVRAWIQKYGEFASQVVESLRENLDIINALDAGEEVEE
jgi:predicted transcriptional regulator